MLDIENIKWAINKQLYGVYLAEMILYNHG